MRLHHRMRCVAQQALGILLGASWEALPGCGGPLEGSETALGCSWVPLEGPGTALARLLEGFWEVLGGFQEASWTKDRKS